MSDGLVMRYRTERVDDGLPPGEGVFLACSFWMVSALKMLGRVETPGNSSSVCSRCATMSVYWRKNTIRRSKRQVGNFPQALSHIALINAAFDFTRSSGGDGSAGERGPLSSKTAP